MNSREKVSIILPTYNGQRYLKQSIESCLNQSYSNIELIIVVDACTDLSTEIVNQLRDSRIKIINHQKNLGLVQSLNDGFAHSTGEFLTWTSDDNLYKKNAIEVMLQYLKNDSHVQFVYSFYDVIDENGRFLRRGKVKPPQELDVDNYVGGCFLYRREVYQSLGGFNPEAFLAEDYEYWLRVRQHFKMKAIEEVLYEYRLHPKSLTMEHREAKVQQQVKKVREKFIAEFKSNFLNAKEAYYRREFSEAKQQILKSLSLNPFYLPSWRLFMLLYLNASLVNSLRYLKRKLIRN